MGYYATFVVRIWCEDTGELNKGYVQHAGTQEQRYFVNMDDLIGFIRSHLIPPTDNLDVDTEKLGERIPTENPEDDL
jgi:hypothetical protein